MSAYVIRPGSKSTLRAALAEINKKITALPAGEAKRILAETAARLAKLVESIEDRTLAAIPPSSLEQLRSFPRSGQQSEIDATFFITQIRVVSQFAQTRRK
jgi:hypothetical protein